MLNFIESFIVLVIMKTFIIQPRENSYLLIIFIGMRQKIVRKYAVCMGKQTLFKFQLIFLKFNDDHKLLSRKHNHFLSELKLHI